MFIYGTWSSNVFVVFQLEMDGKVVELPELEGIVVLNINSWCAGVKMISGNDEALPPVR